MRFGEFSFTASFNIREMSVFFFSSFTYLEHTLHVISDSREPITALFGRVGNAVGGRNGGIRNRVEHALGSPKQVPNQALRGIGVGEESGRVEPDPGHDHGAPEKRFVVVVSSVKEERMVRGGRCSGRKGG